MRFSQGAAYGRYGELYDPEIFNDREEVIVFNREEFGWAFRSMMKQIEYINDINLKLNSADEYKLMGLWPKIMERIHIIDVNIEDFLMQEPVQTHLDAFLYNQTKSKSSELLKSGVKVAEKSLGIDWFK
jgi:hypothetical protein